MQCPRCSVTLDVSNRQGVETDVCPKCRGVWLDRGELDKIIDRYQAWDDDDEREHRPARYPRRRTFWSELFD